MTQKEAGRSTPAELRLRRKAAELYYQAEKYGDSARCYTEIGDFENAAKMFEVWARRLSKAGEEQASPALAQSAAEKLQSAAELYEKANALADAARCYGRTQTHRESARCHLAAHDFGAAAWTYVHLAGAPLQAVDCLAKWERRNPGDKLAGELISIRIDAADKDAQAAGRLQKAIERLETVETTADRKIRLVDWAGQIAEYMGRPDLEALVHAAAFRGRFQNAGEQWQKWLSDRFNEKLH